MSKILQLLGLAPRSDAPTESQAIRRVARALEEMDPAQARHLALFAYLLARVANVDQEITESETDAMARVIEVAGHLPPDRAALVVEIAKAENRLFGATDNFLATRSFRDLATDEQKRDLVHCLFAVAAAEDAISLEEEEAIRGVARELLLTNEEYLSIRSAYREHRSIHRT